MGVGVVGGGPGLVAVLRPGLTPGLALSLSIPQSIRRLQFRSLVAFFRLRLSSRTRRRERCRAASRMTMITMAISSAALAMEAHPRPHDPAPGGGLDAPAVTHQRGDDIQPVRPVLPPPAQPRPAQVLHLHPDVVAEHLG